MAKINKDSLKIGAELKLCKDCDRVEVVRCVHCQHLLKETVAEPTPYRFENEKTSFGCKRALDLTGEWVDVMLDDFCSYGERKE